MKNLHVKQWSGVAGLVMAFGLIFVISEKNMAAGIIQRWVEEVPIPSTIHVSRNQSDLTLTSSKIQIQRNPGLDPVDAWGYNGTSPGPTIEVERGHALRVHWKSQLSDTHIFAMPDGMNPAMQGLPDVRFVTHLHGAVVRGSNPMDRLIDSDGWPDAWLKPGEEQIAEYPNTQSARLLWYHDHAAGTTGRNVAAGLLGLYLIREPIEKQLNLPSGKYEIPLIFVSLGMNADGSGTYTPRYSSEHYGNAVTVNGKLWPKLSVEPRKYRFRIVNASNARTYGLKLFDADDISVPGPAFSQIGNDGGFLEKPVILNGPDDATTGEEALRLTLGPSERGDVIIDFAGYAGKNFLLFNNSLDPGDGEMPIPQLMMFKVGQQVTEVDHSQIPARLRTIPKLKESNAVQTRKIALKLRDIPAAPMLTFNNLTWADPITERPVLGTTEIWELINTMPDIHPFHMHLVNFQVLDRRPIDADAYLATGELKYTDAAVAPDPNELGWKDTVRLQGNSVTRIIMKFGPYTGYYAYHCHILEHEDMDMMRPFEVVAP